MNAVTFFSARRPSDMRNALLSSASSGVAGSHQQTRVRNRPAFWFLLIVSFLLLSLAAAVRGDELRSTANRTEHFSSPGEVRSLAVENISGRVTVNAGVTFGATVELVARARTASRAQQTLDQAKVVFENRNGEVVLFIEEPGTTVRRTGRGWNIHSHRDSGEARLDARYLITVPAGASVNVSSVNGGVEVKGISGPLELSTVNGKIEFEGARRNAKLNTVNGTIEGTFAELPRGTSVDAETVNGNVTLRLPAGSGFAFSGRTMGGDIVSTFPLPPVTNEGQEELSESRAEREKLRAERRRAKETLRERTRRKVREESRAKGKGKDRDDEIEIDLSDLNIELEEMNGELAEMGREIGRSVVRNLNRSYVGTVGNGGATIHCSNLNGRIAILGEGTRDSDARSIVSSRSARIITVPPMPHVPHIVVTTIRQPSPPRVPRAPQTPRAPHAPRAPETPGAPESGNGEEQGSIVRGDISGDFYSSLPFGDVRIGNVSGAVKVTTHSGQIQVGSAGKGAELSSSGGDVRVESVNGNLVAFTNGGDVVVGSCAGDARLETKGGDVTIRSCGGSVTARTGGGDIHLSRLKGAVRAETAGGTVDAEILVTEPRGASELSSHGGDVNLKIPANFRGDVDVQVTGVDSEGDFILSDFPELAITRRSGSQSASGKLNGGGAKLQIRCISGTVTIRKG